jgi:Tfp pilus assembly protein PilO
VDKMKQWIALTVVGALAIAAGGWFLLISPKRADASALRDEATSRQQANTILVNQLAQLKAKAKDLPKEQAKLAAVAAKIPGNSALPALIRALNDAADETGVELVSMAPGQPAAVAPAVATTTTTAAGSKSAAAPSGGAGSAAVGTLQSIPLALNVVGSYFQVAEYLDRLENLSRAFRVSAFNLTPGLNPVKKPEAQPTVDSGKILTATISGLVFQTTGNTTAALTTAK